MLLRVRSASTSEGSWRCSPIASSPSERNEREQKLVPLPKHEYSDRKRAMKNSVFGGSSWFIVSPARFVVTLLPQNACCRSTRATIGSRQWSCRYRTSSGSPARKTIRSGWQQEYSYTATECLADVHYRSLVATILVQDMI